MVSYKGGVGKTTTAVHLAGVLQQNAPTLLIDGDYNRSCLSWAAAGLLGFDVLDESAGARRRCDYSHVVIDTPARPTRPELRALAAADLVVIPSTPDALSLAALRQTVNDLRTHKGARYRVLLTAVPPRPSRAGEDARAMLEGAGLPVFESAIRRLAAFGRAVDGGVLIRDVADPRAAAGWADYLGVGEELLHGA